MKNYEEIRCESCGRELKNNEYLEGICESCKIKMEEL